jgi:hypothetical protein
MPNLEHLRKLDEGVAAWNEWRSQNPDLNIDLEKPGTDGKFPNLLTPADQKLVNVPSVPTFSASILYVDNASFLKA